MKNTKPKLMRRVMLRLTSEIFKLVKPLDSYLMKKKFSNKDLRYPPIFIIGAPRTGSTLIYQVITNHFDICYISNFSAAFFHSLYTGMILENSLLGKSPHNLFNSYYGMSGGLRGPNECGQFWYRWFPKERHFIAANDFKRDELIEIRNIIGAITKKLSKPIIFKNLNNGQRLQAIHKILPESLFIFIRRDPVFTAQSILTGRYEFYRNQKKWLSVMPKNISELKKKHYTEQVVKQVYYLEKQIYEDLKLFPAKQQIIMRYENFCKNTNEELKRLKYFFINNNIDVNHREKEKLLKFQIDTRILVNRYDLEKIKKETEKIVWSFDDC